ncbi:MAG: alpha/beta fold hydrolase [Ferruginibacter sp.]
MKTIWIVLVCFCLTTSAQTPPRKATMGLIAKPVAKGIIVDSIIANSSFAALALQKGDVITELNGNKIASMEAYGKIASNIRAGEKVEVKFIRNQQNLNASGSAVMRPYEQSDIADVQYDWVKFRNGYLRAITRKPKDKTNCAAILLIPGYGCGSIENYMSNYNGKILTEWLKAGYAVVTIEKSGLGDSYNCVPCGDVDLATDIESFDAGYNYMEQLPFVDKDNLYIWGHSLGGIIAPEIAKRHHPKGVMVFGTTFRPWSEFLLEMHRVQKPLLENQTYLQTEDFMRKIQKIYYEFFILRKTREELLKNPEYKDLVVSELGYKEGTNDMWGRHWAFWPQIDSLNLAQSWQAINCPVLILHGAADYESCSIAEPQLITACVNAAHPGNATMVVVPELDHFMMKSKNWQEARDNFKKQQYNKGNFNYSIAEETVNWLKKH